MPTPSAVDAESRLGRAYSLAGRHSEGLSFLDQGEKESESVGALQWHSLHVAWQVEEHLQAGPG